MWSLVQRALKQYHRVLLFFLFWCFLEKTIYLQHDTGHSFASSRYAAIWLTFTLPISLPPVTARLPPTERMLPEARESQHSAHATTCADISPSLGRGLTLLQPRREGSVSQPVLKTGSSGPIVQWPILHICSNCLAFFFYYLNLIPMVPSQSDKSNVP